MKIAFALTLLFAGIVGCVGSQSTPLVNGYQSTVPRMPSFTTEQGKACARTCQATYAECNKGCSQMIGGAVTAQQRMQCLNNCNKILSDCYATCE